MNFLYDNEFSDSCFFDQIQTEDVLSLKGEQFSFHDLNLTVSEKDHLSKIQVTNYGNVVGYSSDSLKVRKKIDEILFDATNSSHDEREFIADLMIRLIENVNHLCGCENSEVIIRSEPQRSVGEKDCIYWHVDRSHDEIAGFDGAGFAKMTFIIPLVGETTLFHEIDDAQRQKFYQIVNETKFYYGHNGSCYVGDEVDRLFDRGKIERAELGQASVHLIGREFGAVHASPNGFSGGRLLVLLTPIYARGR